MEEKRWNIKKLTDEEKEERKEREEQATGAGAAVEGFTEEDNGCDELTGQSLPMMCDYNETISGKQIIATQWSTNTEREREAGGGAEKG